MKLTYACKNCKKNFLRYASQIRNPHKCFCSVVCKGVWQKENKIATGVKNPNYKHGGFVSNRKCYCGNKVDYRARKCWSCKLVKFTTKQLKIAIAETKSFSEAATKLKASRASVTRKAKAAGLSIAHFIVGRNRNIPDEILFSKGVRRHATVKERLIKNKIFKYKCKLCGLSPVWLGKKLVLELDHEDGNSSNNELTNLRFLCPNCHSQTPTNKGKNYHAYV